MAVVIASDLQKDIASEVKTEIDHASEPSDRHRHEIQVEKGTRLGKILGQLDFLGGS